MQIDHGIMLCARDAEKMYFDGVPLSKAIRHMQYICNPYEVQAAKRDLQRYKSKGRTEYNWYRESVMQRQMKAKR